jgi:CRP-like cAMP-binding protein
MILIMSHELIELLRAHPHRKRDAPEGSVLFHRDAPVQKLYVVDIGMIELRRYTESGDTLVLQRAFGQSILAEASVYSPRYHCDAVVVEPARLIEFSKRRLLEAMTANPELLHLWGAYLAAAVQNARHRAEILSRRSVAARLSGWLAMHDDEMPVKGQWKQIATEIGVAPEALYREIARRRGSC